MWWLGCLAIKQVFSEYVGSDVCGSQDEEEADIQLRCQFQRLRIQLKGSLTECGRGFAFVL